MIEYTPVNPLRLHPSTLQEYTATGDRLRAFRKAYHSGKPAIPPEPVPTLVSLWEEATA